MNEYNEAMANEYSYEYWLSRHDLHNDCSMADCVECVKENEAMESENFYRIELSYADCPENNATHIVTSVKLLQMLSWLQEHKQSIDAGTFQLYLMIDSMTMTIKPE